ncbi:MAG: transglycosylase domain-containing protein, partial [Chloroflexi bacterium]|nr:transglycosylase domain-containing protein [Chloroflexota bacterium]
MAYRPLSRRARIATPDAQRSIALRRLALSRVRSRPRSGGGMAMPLIGITALVLVAVITASALAVGGGAAATYESLAEGLPDPARLEELDFAQPTMVYDRTGTVEIARFTEQRRSVVTFEQIPQLVLDATTVTEDATFWENQGFDPNAIISAILGQVSGSSDRGGSTITQQLVRARLLPQDLLAPGADRYLRKAKELIQAQRLTEAFPGEAGKQRIITAYMNQIFYGQSAYGIAAAADVMFGVTDLSKLTPAQAALLAGLPQNPNVHNPYRHATETEDGKLIVANCRYGADLRLVDPNCTDVSPVARRNYILTRLYSPGGRWKKLTREELLEGLNEPIELIGERPLIYIAPHFVWQMKKQLDQILSDRTPAERGGYKVITTIDLKAQEIAERYITAGAILPHMAATEFRRTATEMKLRKDDQEWIARLRGKNIRNAAMVALDYRNGDVLAYVGSAGYYREDLATKKFNPKYDVAGDGFRQPGSAFKPVVYATAIEERKVTAGTMLLDVTTPFGRTWTPRDADRLERGPVRVRKALQYSLNIPAIRAMERVGPTVVAKQATRMGIKFPNGEKSLELGGLAGAIGTVEVRPIDLTAAFGVFGNGGVYTEPRMILEVLDANRETLYQAGTATRTRALSPQTAYVMSDILAGSSDPAENLIWGPKFQIRNGPNGERRIMAVKTGTTNDIRDLSTYGFLPAPKDPGQPALSVGVWMGNSDHTPPRASSEPAFATDGPGRIWRAFLRDYMQKKPVPDFKRPNGLVQATIDAWSGGRPGPWTEKTAAEWFLSGTQPGSRGAIDPAGLLYVEQCGEWRVDVTKAEPGSPRAWQDALKDWMRRAREGPGRVGRHGAATAYFWGEGGTWGGKLAETSCVEPTPSPSVTPSGEPTPSPEPTRTPKPTRT